MKKTCAVVCDSFDALVTPTGYSSKNKKGCPVHGVRIVQDSQQRSVAKKFFEKKNEAHQTS